jgi:hypothetical protein
MTWCCIPRLCTNSVGAQQCSDGFVHDRFGLTMTRSQAEGGRNIAVMSCFMIDCS